MRPEIILLNLLRPLLYEGDESTALIYRREDGEKLYCFELEESAAQKFEPQRTLFPGALIFVGKTGGKEEPGAATLELKPGTYVFCQVKEILDREGIVDLAIEVQNEGLWQRLKLGARFYVRYLLEDGRGVTQIFRPYN